MGSSWAHLGSCRELPNMAYVTPESSTSTCHNQYTPSNPGSGDSHRGVHGGQTEEAWCGLQHQGKVYIKECLEFRKVTNCDYFCHLCVGDKKNKTCNFTCNSKHLGQHLGVSSAALSLTEDQF